MDYIARELSEFSLSKLFVLLATSSIVFGGIVPYVPQYQEIKRTDNAEGFSLYVCLALLLANSLRILFWFGKRYEFPLLLQSILMNFTMLVMIKLCVRVRNRNQPFSSRDRLFLDFDSRYFWQWTDFQSYVDFMLLFSVVTCALTYIFLDSVLYVETLGFLSVFIEALLGMPQLIRNYKQQSTQGMSIAMVLMWTAGDIFKTFYFLIRDAPVQFTICGCLQILIDLSILLQVRMYGKGPAGPRRD